MPVYILALAIFAILRLPYPGLDALLPSSILSVIMGCRINERRLMWWRLEGPVERANVYTLAPDVNEQEPNDAQYVQVGDLIHDDTDKTADESPQEYFKIIAKLVWPDGGRISICMLGLDLNKPYQEVNPNHKFIQYKGVLSSEGRLKPVTDEMRKTAGSLADLISLLAEKPGMRESAVVASLVQQRDYDNESVRRAIRLALSGRLVDRIPGRNNISEFIMLFRSAAFSGGHDSCFLELTESGRIWQRIGSSEW